MRRTLMQIYVKGSDEAVKFYQSAFDAPLVAAYRNDDGTYMHAELDVYGQVLAVSEEDNNRKIGNGMQFCLHFDNDEKDKVTKAYDILAEDALEIREPLGPCSYSPHMASLIDRFGVFWCIFS
ncbi:MAG: VOC family protein [Anaerolineae bacterium]